MSDDYEIRPLQPDRPGEVDSLLETYAAAFGGGGEGRGAPRTREEWSWAFEHNPAGLRSYVALRRGRVVAQYAALPVPMLVDGRGCTGLHVVDSMVHPEHRAAASQPGLFVRTARAFFDAHGAPDRDPIHFGWPVERAWRVGRRLLDYEIVRVQNALVGDPDAAGTQGPPEGVDGFTPGPGSGFDAGFDALGRRCAADVGASALRSGAWLDWRYAKRPGAGYRALCVRGSGAEPAGLCVWRPDERFGVPGLALVCEWLVPLGETAVAEALFAALEADAAGAGRGTLAVWCPEWSPWCTWMQERGLFVQPTDYLTTARSWWRHADLAWLRDHWWYQLGDTDLV